MIRIVTISAFTVAAVSSSIPARAFPGMPSAHAPAAGGATPEKLDAFLAAATDAEKLVRTAEWHLAAAVLSKDKYEEFAAKRKAINEIQDPQEKEAKLKELDTNVQEQLAKADYQKASEDEKKADDEHKKQTAIALYNFTLGVLKDAALVLDAKGLTGGAPSPAVATKVATVTATAKSLAAQADSQQKVMGGAKVMMASDNLKALPTKASDKPQPEAD